MRDSALIYRSFYDAIKELEPIHQSTLWAAIFEYAFDKHEHDLTGVCKTVFTLIKPQLDANLKRFENGKRPKTLKTESEAEANHKQTISKSEANNNNNNNNNDNDNDNDNNNVNNNNNVNIPFGDFWELYDKKVGEKKKIEIKWNKLKDTDRQAIMEYIPRYIKSQPDKKYRKNPETFLNNKSWNDEIIGEFKASGLVKKQIRQMDFFNYEDYVSACDAEGITPEPPEKW